MNVFCFLGVSLVVFAPAFAENDAADWPKFHLMGSEWAPVDVEAGDVWDSVESLCRFAVQYRDEGGAFIDPILDREFQYATPYLAYAIGALVDAGRGEDLLEDGVAAMEHATKDFARGNEAIPDQHGEFYLASLAGAFGLYEGHVPEDTHARWRERLETPLLTVIEGIDAKINNWRTYAMNGEWQRYRAGLVSREDAVEFIEDAWHKRTQRERMLGTRYQLYQDWNGDPQSHAVEAVGRGNLLLLVHSGYDGPSAAEMREAVEAGTKTTMLLQGPTGQCPPNGRTDNHVFNDVLYALEFAAMAQRAKAASDMVRAKQYRRAALLGYQSILRWKRDDGEWAGSFSITKNFFHPFLRVGYQPASQYSNYSGAVMYHLAELAHLLEEDIGQQPAPNEIGGYVIENDGAFGSAAMNAGGLQVFANLRGDTVPKYGTYWTPLGIARVSRPGWDARLGLSDGVYDAEDRRGLTIGPEWPRGPRWVRLADRAQDYRGVLVKEFVSPVLVRARLTFAPVTGVGGPPFILRLTLTPEGVLIRASAPVLDEFGMTLPVLASDGRHRTTIKLEKRVLRSWYDKPGERQGKELVYVLLKGKGIVAGGDALRSTYGMLEPYRAESVDGELAVFVYPRLTNETLDVSKFALTDDGFTTDVSEVSGTIYNGPQSAGGKGKLIDIDGDGSTDVTFDTPCTFVLQKDGEKVTSVEADRRIGGAVGKRKAHFSEYEPVEFGE